MYGGATLVVLLLPVDCFGSGAVLTPIGLEAFSGNETVVDFGTEETFEVIHGESFGGVDFFFTIDGIGSDDAILDSGPGPTNNIAIANIEGNALGVLSMELPGPQQRIGYGWGMSAMGGVSTTHVSLYDANDTLLGTLMMNGSPDPAFNGGFLGVASSQAFTRADVSWSGDGPRFAFDNLRFDAVPEPATAAQALLAALVIGWGGRRRR